MIRKIFVKIRDGKEYQVFMDLETCAYKDDQEICLQIFKKYITGFSILEDYFEEKNIHWASDYYLAVWLAMKTIKNFKQEDGRSTHLPPVLKTSDDDDNEDLDFIKRLFIKTILKQEESEKLIEERARNLEIDRIAMMDKLIISMAVTELIEFPSIPVKVTLNEYIELAKIFSTSKSRVFINGILDKLISDLKKEKKIIKTGRGLID